MTAPNLTPGNRFRAYRAGGSSASGVVDANDKFICLATSITLTITNSFEDATVPDCDNPTAVPARQSVLSSTSWGGRVAGQVDAKRLAGFRADAASQVPVAYKFLLDKAAADGGGAWNGGVFIENLEIGKTNNGIVSFTAQFRGDAALVWVDAT